MELFEEIPFVILPRGPANADAYAAADADQRRAEHIWNTDAGFRLAYKAADPTERRGLVHRVLYGQPPTS